MTVPRNTQVALAVPGLGFGALGYIVVSIFFSIIPILHPYIYIYVYTIYSLGYYRVIDVLEGSWKRT